MNGPEVYATVFALGPGKTDVNVLWAGSDDGLVHVTRNGGKTWTNVTPKDMPEFGRVSIIDASQFDAGTAYIAVKKPLLNDLAPYIFRTHDFGRTWTKIVNGLGPLDYVHVVREDPTRRGLLYAGTQHAAYISYDDGDHWSSLSLNLPDVPVKDLIVEGNDLAIATHGRGFYILDDIGPLRQVGGPVANAARVFLFKPNDAIRSFGGATIRYWVKQPLTTVKVEILDAKGALIREFAMPAAGAGGRAGAPGAGVGGGGRGGRGGGAALSAAAGLNSVHLGPALSGGDVLPRHDFVGRQRQRTIGASRDVSGADDGGWRNADAAVRGQAPPAAGRDRRRPAGAVRPRDPDPGQDERSQ